MKGSTEVVKGRIEEAAGVLAGNRRLRAKGQTDQAVGHIKQVAEQSVQQIKMIAERVADGATFTRHRTVSAKSTY